jgi:hypothetical protein
VKLVDGGRRENLASFDVVEGFWKSLYSTNRYLAEASHSNVVSSPNEALRQKLRVLHSRHSFQCRQEAWSRGY